MSGKDPKNAIVGISFRAATAADVPGMTACRLADAGEGSPDERMTAYFLGQHHPQRALMPRVGYVTVAGDAVIGYIAGHLTTRHDCAGEVQYLFVASKYRRCGIASALLRLLAGWFQEHAAAKVCVCVDADSPAAQPFYKVWGHLHCLRSGNTGMCGMTSMYC